MRCAAVLDLIALPGPALPVASPCSFDPMADKWVPVASPSPENHAQPDRTSASKLLQGKYQTKPVSPGNTQKSSTCVPAGSSRMAGSKPHHPSACRPRSHSSHVARSEPSHTSACRPRKHSHGQIETQPPKCQANGGPCLLSGRPGRSRAPAETTPEQRQQQPRTAYTNQHTEKCRAPWPGHDAHRKSKTAPTRRMRNMLSAQHWPFCPFAIPALRPAVAARLRPPD